MSHVHQLSFPIKLPAAFNFSTRRRDLQSLFNEFSAHVYRHSFLIDYFLLQEGEKKTCLFVNVC